ncbi:MAG: ATP-dependent helicase HrpB [Alphaproteobacteria bacterium]
MPDLPILAALPALLDALAAHNQVVLQAPPGAGKTTAVPPALLDVPWLSGGRVVMLEPRRIAARAAATFMARQRGEKAGDTVGYRTRLDTRVGRDTRIEVVTEGVLTRMLQSDPGLDGVAAVIFDEFHERHLQGDLGLALALDAQAGLRPDLRLLVMSATLDLPGLRRALPEAAVVESAAPAFPVETHYLGRPERRDLGTAVAAACRRALAEGDGDVLAFLPGIAEIRQVGRALALPDNVDVHVLHGSLAPAAQDAALAPAPAGRRKLVLASAIAESSVTVDGVRAVVDAGLARRARFSPATGMTALVTERASQAAAAQRAGRAGRQGPGRCYRMWSEAEQRGLAPRDPPEILEADLAPLALECALWGSADLDWPDPPPTPALARANELLAQLGALDESGRITSVGRRMAGLGTHPRLAHMLVADGSATACDLAALLGERDFLSERDDPDLERRLTLLRDGRPARGLVDVGTFNRVRQAASSFRRQLKIAGDSEPGRAGAVLALAYPDRLAQARGGDGRYRLAHGGGARLSDQAAHWSPAFLAIAELGGGSAREPIIRLAAALSPDDVTAAGVAGWHETVAWDARANAVAAHRQYRVGALVLREEPLAAADLEQVTAALLDGVRALGLARLPWTDGLANWRARVAFLRRTDKSWPDLSDAALLGSLDDWLGPFVAGFRRADDLRQLDLLAALQSLLPPDGARRLAREAPAEVALPDGRRYRLDYEAGERPVLAVRLQALLGVAETPTVAGLPVEVHLLSPAGRPIQITRDLAGFWRGSYAEVRKAMRGRYPKHAWPEDPLAKAH